ncbi:outer membrane protein [Anaeromyxobacter paludicola]|uniref:Outer membrane protein beta-barrel domain-containing protein n=1 Tax=Anaeromyxobacter paludicola TaxID=2918171 RepID=A0ABM7X7H7_9BACT|nr:hypothetical protein [Anaeromyxobacter paludicola]BDG07803.1 hypothetical protein AMPC_09160 [Anaeromyxobacter paludicola]
MNLLAPFAKRLGPAFLAGLLLLPAVAGARAPAATGGDTTLAPGAMAWGVLGAIDIPTASGSNVGPRLIGEGMYGIGEIAPNLRLDVGPRLAFTYNGGDASLWTLDALGVGRLSYALDPRLSVYGEAGLGFGYYHWSVDVGAGSVSDSGLMFDLLIAPGVIYALGPNLNLLGEVGFWINAKSGLGTHIAIPTVGVQWKM